MSKTKSAKRTKQCITADSFLAFCLQNVKPCLALEYAKILHQGLDRNIHITQLRNLTNPWSEDTWEYDSPEYVLPDMHYCNYQVPELPIEAIDHKTEQEIKAHIAKTLSSYQAARADHNFSRADELYDKLLHLEKYLKSSTSKGGIRYLRDRKRADYHVVKAAFGFLRKALLKISPEHAAYLDAHLIIKYGCTWITGEEENQF